MVRVSCKVCRRLGFSVCGREKCAFRKKPYAPGVHGKGLKRSRPSSSEYGAQLKEKQKIKFLYGLRERQFRNIVKTATATKGVENTRRIMELLEGRLDNVVYRLGFAPTRAAGRQLVGHGHIMVNGRKVTIPSFEVRVGDRIAIRPQSAVKAVFGNLDILLKKYEAPSWIELDKGKKEGVIASKPNVTDADLGVNSGVVVEFYSR
ncbi:MAG: 30S ribosomal protein S4 [Candidatus Niyogibacteria bacterium]|nr:30S ribosomal protein S4 [Candidatus Niyogibacteria bacterium]